MRLVEVNSYYVFRHVPTDAYLRVKKLAPRSYETASRYELTLDESFPLFRLDTAEDAFRALLPTDGRSELRPLHDQYPEGTLVAARVQETVARTILDEPVHIESAHNLGGPSRPFDLSRALFARIPDTEGADLPARVPGLDAVLDVVAKHATSVSKAAIGNPGWHEGRFTTYGMFVDGSRADNAGFVGKLVEANGVVRQALRAIAFLDLPPAMKDADARRDQCLAVTLSDFRSLPDDLREALDAIELPSLPR